MSSYGPGDGRDDRGRDDRGRDDRIRDDRGPSPPRRRGRRSSRSYTPSPPRRRSRSRSPPPRYRRDRSYSPPPRDRYYDRRDRGPPPRDYPPPRYGGYDDRRGPPPGYRDGPPPFHRLPPWERGGRGDDRPGPPGARGGAEDRPGPPPGRRDGRRREEGPPGVSLLIRNVSPDITQEDLTTAFGRIGDIRDVYIPRDFFSHQPKGFAFIEYANPERAAEARDEMNHFVIKGRELEVVFAQERRKTPNEMRGRVVNQQNHRPPSSESRERRSSSFERHKRAQKTEPDNDDEEK